MTDVVFQEPGVAETRQERALRRAAQLHNAFQSVFEVLAEIYHDEDWRYINDMAGRPYTGFTAFVQDQLGCAASNARRYQQGIVGLILPLRQVALPGARIPVTSSDVARLGVAGARVVVEEAPAALKDKHDPDAQTEALRELIDSVAKKSSEPGFGPVRESSLPAAPLGALVPSEVPDEWASPPAAAPSPHAGSPIPPSPDRIQSPPPETDADGAEATKPDSVDDQPVWVSQSPTNIASTPPAPTVGDGRAASIAAGGPIDPDAAKELEAAIAAILAVGDPAALAEQLSSSAGAELAPKCLASGQRLVRLGQMLRTLS